MRPLNSIVVGDVGSGKTAVAFSVAVAYLMGVEKGSVSFMAPTELLAEQHYEKLVEYLETFKQKHTIVPVLITSKKRLVQREKLSKKQLQVVLKEKQKIVYLGTHALLHSDLEPELVMVDEQHRFGVRERATKSQGYTPHFISFSATPIPRTLALTAYKHLDLLTLERLTNRAAVLTNFVPLANTELLLSKIKEHIDTKGKVYVLVPAVESTENEDLYTVEKAKKLVNRVVAEEHIVITHGKHKTKLAELERFRNEEEVQICIATSVIEVGVDVPQATLMIILNADRFGLATLHQLRGRVGRNERNDNECIVAAPFRSKRLSIVCYEGDGFVIAEKDLELRGSGSMTGTLQSGFDDTTELIIGLNSTERAKLFNSIESTNLESQTFSRLKNYLSKKYEESWKE